MTVRIAIDLNVRVRGGQIYAGFEEIQAGDATVLALAVEWRGFRDDPQAREDPSCE